VAILQPDIPFSFLLNAAEISFMATEQAQEQILETFFEFWPCQLYFNQKAF
jgi:hypothetical protein